MKHIGTVVLLMFFVFDVVLLWCFFYLEGVLFSIVFSHIKAVSLPTHIFPVLSANTYEPCSESCELKYVVIVNPFGIDLHKLTRGPLEEVTYKIRNS